MPIPQGGSGKRWERTKYDDATLSLLEGEFLKNRFPDAGEIKRIAEVARKNPRHIKVWFQNHRQRRRSARGGVGAEAPYEVPPFALLLCGMYVTKRVPADVTSDAVFHSVCEMSACETTWMAEQALRELDAVDLEYLQSLE